MSDGHSHRRNRVGSVHARIAAGVHAIQQLLPHCYRTPLNSDELAGRRSEKY
jgi:hypothetical protein